MLSLNHYWRIIAAGISYIVFGIGAFFPGIYIFFIALFPIDAATKQRKVRNAIKYLCRFYVDFMQFLGLMSYTVTRQSTSQKNGLLVICNHSMLIDALFVLAYVDNICCVVKDALCHNPFTRIPIRLAGYISNSSEDFVEQACDKLERGENVLIFPEGTRNFSDFQLEFRRGAANIAVMSEAPVLPMVIRCIPRALGKKEPWYQLPDKKSRIIVKINPVLLIDDCIDTNLPRTLKYRRLNEYWREYYRTEIAKAT